jgi:hypothetical protein
MDPLFIPCHLQNLDDSGELSDEKPKSKAKPKGKATKVTKE